MKKLTEKMSNKDVNKCYIPEILLIIISVFVRYFNDEVTSLSLIDNYNLIQLIFIIIGLSITLATFLYALTDRFSKIENDEILKKIQNLEKSIILEIKGMVCALVSIVVLTFIYPINIPFIHAFYFMNKLFICDVIKIYIFFYVLLAFVDIVFTVLALFGITDNNFK